MKNKELLEELKLKSGYSVRLPKGIDLQLDNMILIVSMSSKGLTDNMQTYASAFEAWALCIKSILCEKVGKVIITWEHPSDCVFKELRHYNRFLYRAIRFRDNFEWVELNGPVDDINWIEGELKDWVVNYPKGKAKDEAAHKEARLERGIDERLKEKYGAINADHQLPMGLFYKEVRGIDKNERTPRQGSQIDLWTIDDKTGILYVFELKDKSNKSVGIISELMFYVNVMYDLKEKIINYPDGIKEDEKKNRNLGTIIESIKNDKIKDIVGVFLADDFHPMLKNNYDALSSLLNENRRGIRFERKKLDLSEY